MSRHSEKRPVPRVRASVGAVLVGVVGLAGCGSDEPEVVAGPSASALRVAPPPPPLTLPDVAGVDVTLEQFRGRTVIVNFWATWCPPCRREMPSLIELHERMADRGLDVLAVSIDEDRQALDAFLDEYPLPFHVLVDPRREVFSAYGVTVTPTAFIVDPRGRVVDRVEGEADWSDPELLRTLEAAIASAGTDAV